MNNFSERNRKVAINRWKKAFEIQTKQLNENSKKYPRLKARIIGHLMGDGSVTIRKEKGIHYHHTIRFYPDDQGMLNSFLEAFLKVYGIKPNVVKFDKYFYVRTDSKPVVNDLLVNYGSFSSTKWLVPNILINSKGLKQEFLKAFYDCEGYVGPRAITVQSVNQKGLKQIQSLLAEFEIKSKMYKYERKNKNWNTNFLLCITKKEDRKRFLKTIGFNHLRKQRKLKIYADVA